MQKRLLLIIALCLGHSCMILAQFYNGHQMSFGKNRVQYDEFYWQYFRLPDYDIYYSTGGKKLAEYAKTVVPEEFELVQKQLGHNYQGRTIFIVFNSLTDLRQSNIGLNSSEDQYNIGGTRLIVSNRILLYFDGNHNNFKKQIRKGAASLIIKDVLQGGGGYKEALNSSSTFEYPIWFTQGLESYISDPNNLEIEEQIRIMLFSGKLKNYNRLFDDDAIVAGHLLWKYIYEQYGNTIAGNIISMSRVTKNVEQSFSLVLGIPIKTIIKEMNDYYLATYRAYPDTLAKVEAQPIVKRQRKFKVYYNQCVAPNNDTIVYAINDKGRIRIEQYCISSQNKTTIKKWGQKLERIQDYTYPVFAWHPSSHLLSIFYEIEGHPHWALYNYETNEWIIRKMHGFEKVLSAQYSPDGRHLLLSGVQKGQTDIFIYSVGAKTYRNITNDLADEVNPIYTDSGKNIVYASNKSTNDTVAGQYFGLYRQSVHFGIPERIHSFAKANNIPEFSDSKDSIFFISDADGINNKYSVVADSSIISIDTTIHYLYSSSIQKQTNSIRHLRGYGTAQDTNIYIIKNNKRHQILSKKSLPESSGKQYVTPFKRKQLEKEQQDSTISRQIYLVDSLRHEIEKKRIKKDSTNIDNYIFLAEANHCAYYDSLFALNTDSTVTEIPSVYQTSFYVNSIVNQIDFGFLNESYQSFTGGPVFFSPGMNVYFKLGIIDLFEDYRLTGGFRFSGSFDSNEYLFTLENYKKRWDKKIIFHRQTITEYYSDRANKIHDHELMYSLSYPFSEVTSIRITPSARWDRITRLAVVNTDLKIPIEHTYRGGGKIEYIFDNSIRKSLNLYNGIRTKLFFEYYQQLNKLEGNLFVAGADYRQYVKLYRNSIFAFRFATSTSFGQERLLYYLGGVDNWINVFSNYTTYDESVEYDKNTNWTYQATATNMRGFNQNVLNGNTFALFNAEIRCPIVKFFAQRPISSEFLSNFQTIAFFDAGSAWTGVFPDTKNNAYNYRVVENGPVTATIDRQKDPYVSGFGWGLRTRVFGYFIRTDWAWGIERSMIRPRIFYLSLSLDF